MTTTTTTTLTPNPNQVINTKHVPSGCSYSYTSKAMVFNGHPSGAWSSPGASPYELFCIADEDEDEDEDDTAAAAVAAANPNEDDTPSKEGASSAQEARFSSASQLYEASRVAHEDVTNPIPNEHVTPSKEGASAQGAARFSSASRVYQASKDAARQLGANLLAGAVPPGLRRSKTGQSYHLVLASGPSLAPSALSATELPPGAAAADVLEQHVHRVAPQQHDGHDGAASSRSVSLGGERGPRATAGWGGELARRPLTKCPADQRAATESECLPAAHGAAKRAGLGKVNRLKTV